MINVYSLYRIAKTETEKERYRILTSASQSMSKEKYEIFKKWATKNRTRV